MGLQQELTAVATPALDAAAAAEEPPPPEGKETKEPDLKKRKKNDEQEPTPPLPDASGAAVAADQHDAADQPAVLSEPPARGPAEACTLGKHVADASRSNNDSKDGSKKTKRRKADQVTTDEEAPRLFSVDAASCTAVDSKDGVINDHGASIDKKQEAESRVVQDMGLPIPTMSLAPGRKKKKLLILDLNGLLADINQDKHNAHLSHGKFRGKLVFKRPYCDDFLRFCIQHFELGIWSSRLRANVNAVVNILMKDLKHHLLFCWVHVLIDRFGLQDMSKCTSTGLNTHENKVKPLVLKELRKLWDKEEEPHLPWQQGEFSPSNTLLVDDSPYKALRNPPHTAIFPCPYSYKNDKDDALGPDGELRLYLESLATADDDVQRYVREHPFGQPPITETHPDWNLYRRVLLTSRVEDRSN